MPPEVAVYGDGDDDTLHHRPRYWVFHGRPGGHLRRVRGARCELAGVVVDVEHWLRVRSRGREGT